ncbi:MAG: hypothetical protein IJP02_04360 [Oscillospiraceae bacterium]|nr:hypothetical protein [Oscillospiraceae bacterium]
MDQNMAQALKLLKDKQGLRQLLESPDTRRMMELLEAQGGVQQAARAAAAGDTAQLMNMMNKLMAGAEGARVVERITKQADQAGI